MCVPTLRPSTRKALAVNAPETPSRLLPFSMLMLTLVLAALDQTILSTALPVMARELTGSWPLAWVFSAYLLAATIVIALYGRLADVLGRKPMLLLAIGLFLLGSLACGASRDLPQLVLARALQGAGGGGLLTLTMLTVADLFAPEERGRYQALLGAAYGVSTMFGPLVGGTLVEHLTWHWAFWLNVPLALLAWGVLAATVPARPSVAQASAPRPSVAQIDWLGAALLSVALVGLLLATQHERLHLDAMAPLWLLVVACGLCTAAFLWRQQRAAHPLLPLSLFARPAYAAVSAIGLATGVALYAAVVFLPQYLQTGLHLSPTGSALHLMPLMAGITAAAIGSGRLLRAQTPAVVLARVACALMLLSNALLMASLHWWPATAPAISASLLPLGMGLGLLFPIITVVAQRVSPPQHMGIATAVPVMLRSLGGACGVALLAALLTRHVGEELSAPAAFAAGRAEAVTAALAHGLQPVFGWTAAVVVLALLASQWLPQRRAQAAGADATVRAVAS